MDQARLKRLVLALCFCLGALTGVFGKPVLADDLTLERIFADPPLVGDLPRALQYSPDGQTLGYLKGNGGTPDGRDFWIMDAKTGARRKVFSPEDFLAQPDMITPSMQAARERDEKGLGPTSFTWSPDGKSVLFSIAGDLVLVNPDSGVARAITDSRDVELSAQFSPDGRKIAYVRDGNIHVLDLTTMREQRLTTDGRAIGPVRNGLPEYIASEEMKRFGGFWWSPDNRRIAFIRTDESGLESSPRIALDSEGFTRITPYYPRAGAPNARVRLGIVNVGSKRKRWAKIDDFEYLARVHWTPDGDGLVVVTQSRDQKSLEVTLLDRKGRPQKTLLRERTDSWVNLTHDLTFLTGRNQFVWSSERDGQKRVYLYDLAGNDLGPLTSGLGYIDEVAGADPEAGRLYVLGWAETPLEKQLYVTDLDPATDDAPTLLTAAGRWHHAVISPDYQSFVDVETAPTDLPRVALRSVDGTLLDWIEENRLTAEHPYAAYANRHVAPSFGTIAAEDGTPLHYRLVKPKTEGPHPAIIHVYGGPKGQLARRSWMPLWYQVAVARGYVVFSIDNRGTARRSHSFEAALRGRLGAVEVRDQLKGLEWLRRQPFVDPDRIAVRGWSYGGYMALKLILAAPDRLAAAVAGAPVTDWRLYDTHYTERFLGLPEDNADAYDASDIFPEITTLSRPLFLIHGLADGNVTIENSTMLMTALQDKSIPFEVMVYPGAGHSINRDGEGRHVEEATFRFLDRVLSP
jgi:dipeptidyl-peptidase-4